MQVPVTQRSTTKLLRPQKKRLSSQQTLKIPQLADLKANKRE
ncbi:MAG: hypothetical protein ACI84K_001403 [Pseudohongiellaceae bacterium]|jgi:hypothetical protein